MKMRLYFIYGFCRAATYDIRARIYQPKHLMKAIIYDLVLIPLELMVGKQIESSTLEFLKDCRDNPKPKFILEYLKWNKEWHKSNVDLS